LRVSRYVLHVDLDEFIAAVEILRRPELRGRPVVVGGRGDPTKRGVVSTANYEARRYGVGSGTPLRVAFRKCPDAVFLPVDRAAYDAASEGVMRVLARFTDELEVWGWDEAFLAIEDDPLSTAHAIRAAVLEETGLSCSVGIGDNKLRAKVAAGFAKPAGIHRLDANDWFEVMGDRPTAELWGIGMKTARKLAELDIITVEDLAAADEAELSEALGPRVGPWLATLARGEWSSHVSGAPRRARSRSFELTFDENVDDPPTIEAEVARMARELSAELSGQDRLARGVTVKVRFAPFVTRSRSRRLNPPTIDATELVAAAKVALARFEFDRPVRLVGVKLDLD
jgi:DNA polymerase-4